MNEPSLTEKLEASKIDMPKNHNLNDELGSQDFDNTTVETVSPPNDSGIDEVPASVFEMNDQDDFHNQINNKDINEPKVKPKKSANPNIKKHVIKAAKMIGLVGTIVALSYGGWSYWENRQKLTVQEDTLSSGQINLEMKFNELEVKFFDSQALADAELAKLKTKLVQNDRRLNQEFAEITDRVDGLVKEIEDVKASGESNDNAIYGLTVEAGKIKKLLAGIEDNITKSNQRASTTAKVTSKRTKPKRTKPRGPVTINNINGYKLYSVDTVSGRNKIVLIKGNAIRIIRKGEEFEGFSVKSSSRDTQIVSLLKNSRTYKLTAG
ncbi:hypothetical protein [Moritella sp. F3]|uniref:hypothetical protein n=1 Tax=Moritella sp. F3 TaxID=2718882 RepID=UPI0018E1B7EC|nr:hypothetical protein [Moritella sp. F3]GIC77068.1 hypothetical protein FMO001_17950 [Moritella sp. F1]GIC82187.1 hypothetical protein FMO003_24680 [Moritella sp. F3]